MAGGNRLPKSAQLLLDGRPLLHSNARAIGSLRLLGWRKEESDRESHDLEDDEDEDGHVGDLAGSAAGGVEAEVDSASNELTAWDESVEVCRRIMGQLTVLESKP